MARRETTSGLKPPLRRWVRNVTAVGGTLNALFAAALVFVVLHDFVLAGAAELFPGGARLWELAYRLSLALIGSYLFYFVVVHLKKQEDKENLRPYLRSRTDRIVGRARSLMTELHRASGRDTTGATPYLNEITLDDVQEVCSGVKFHDTAPLFLGDANRNATWIEYLDYHRAETMDFIASIYVASPFLDTEFLKLLVEVEHSFYFLHLKMISGVSLRDGQLSPLAKPMHEFFGCVRVLKEYADRELA